MILLDTNILIEVFKGNPAIIEIVKSMDPNSLALSAITEMELYFGAINKLELKRIKKNVCLFNIIQISTAISVTATHLIEKYSKSHGLKIPDALIAATAIENDSELVTLNTRDFMYINSLKLYEPAGSL